MAERIRLREGRLEVAKQGIDAWQVLPDVRREVLQFLNDLSVGKVNRGKRVGEGAQIKYFNMLKISLEFLSKPTAEITIEDVERFEKALFADEIQTRYKQRPYSSATKSAMRKALKIFFRWRFGQAKALELAGWLDTREKPKTPEFLTEAEVEQLYRACRSPEQRFAVAVLFDSGARAEEFLNIRFEDIKRPEGKDNFVKLTLKEEYSKTMGRNISLFWRHSHDAVQEYLAQRVAAGIKAKDQVFASTYDALRIFLGRLGKDVLKKPVYPHLFRHSSATFYATKLNRQELCYRYGWRFSSNMPDVYISRSGMENKELDEKFTATELSQLKDELVKKEQLDKINAEKVRTLQQKVDVLEQHLHTISEVIRSGVTSQQVESAVQRKRTGT